MLELPVDAKVVCTDGEAGRVVDVVVNPVARTVTHIVVREHDVVGRESLVPLSRVTESNRSVVQLDCSKADLADFPDFTATRFVAASSPEAQPVLAGYEAEMWTSSAGGYEPLYMPYRVAPDEQIAIVEEVVPEGELAFERGARVDSSDGQELGQVEAFLLKAADATISHFVVRFGSTSRDTEVTLPISTVQQATGGIVQLKLSRAEVERLPSVRSTGYAAAEGAPTSPELLSIVFDDPDGAAEALRIAKETARNGDAGRFDAAIVRKGADGKVSSHEEDDITAGRGAAVGAIAGGVMSLLAGPIGLVGGLAVGAATGGAVGLIDRGVPDRYVRDLGRALRAGSSALVLILERGFEATLLDALQPLGGNVLRVALSDEMVARLTAAP